MLGVLGGWFGKVKCISCASVLSLIFMVNVDAKKKRFLRLIQGFCVKGWVSGVGD